MQPIKRICSAVFNLPIALTFFFIFLFVYEFFWILIMFLFISDADDVSPPDSIRIFWICYRSWDANSNYHHIGFSGVLHSKFYKETECGDFSGAIAAVEAHRHDPKKIGLLPDLAQIWDSFTDAFQSEHVRSAKLINPWQKISVWHPIQYKWWLLLYILCIFEFDGHVESWLRRRL